jgi:hypothetical protein
MYDAAKSWRPDSIDQAGDLVRCREVLAPASGKKAGNLVRCREVLA